jgi:hypothetical protein
MRLVPKGYDEYNPVLLLMGTFFVIGGGYGLLNMGFSGPPVVWVVRGIPAVLVTVGLIILITQLQLRRRHQGSK